MDKEEWRPWDCPDTFGKRRVHPDPDQSHLCQWPLKLTRVSSVSPYYHRANLLIAADCSAYSYLRFHHFAQGKVLTIGCPDMEGDAFAQKIEEVLKLNDILSIQLVRMDAPCCRRITEIVMNAVKKSRKAIPLQITTVFAEGEDLAE